MPSDCAYETYELCLKPCAFSASFSARRAPLVLRVSLPLPLLCFSAPIVPIVPSCWRWRWRWLRFQLRP